ncbi:glycosyltransferase family 4 protein [Flaviflexus huanghaiensis]|uniref:glycosyltransferase family 4 protein n=1 Tax=Flaviflexus huanghaiensis TaxID=1111473 RepID=UPI0015FC5588|nr:glycosyltransferase family 4 protein [Flaviflexus huanghaiensis]
MQRTLLVTNDFPPRTGGIQTYLEGFVGQLDPDRLVVYASSPPDGGAEEYDASVPYKVIRYPGTMMLPTPRVRQTMQHIIREHDIENVWFGASTPLGIMARAARAAGASQTIATTHGHEIGWSMVPGARQFLARIFRDNDIVTYLTKATLGRLDPLLQHTGRLRLPGGINPEAFAFDGDFRRELRERYRIDENAPVVICISRLVERKGQDLLIENWHVIAQRFPTARLVIVGKGPYREKLDGMREASPAKDSIIFTGEVPYAELAGHYSLGDIYAMPCRTRGGGLDIEGLGIVYLEAYAAGLPVVAGNSGGAPEAVLPGETGLVVNGRSGHALVAALTYLLEDPERAKAMGARGKEWVDRVWRWEHLIKPLKEVL